MSSNYSVDVEEVMSKLEEKYSRRNFALGTIHLAFDLEDPEKAGIESPLTQCIRYFERNASKNACFGDMQSSVTFLSPQDQQDFLKEIKAFPHDDKVRLSLGRENSV
jgi:N-acetyltransferase B complex (NatB) non catalytic subunit